MGQEGIDKFFESHKCNEICRSLGLPCRGGVKDNPQATRVRPAQPGTVSPGQHPQRPPPPHSAPQDAAAVEKAKRELEQFLESHTCNEVEKANRELEQFLESHTCNEICRWPKLPCRGGVDPQDADFHDYLDRLMQIVISSEMDSAKSKLLTDLLRGEGLCALARDQRTAIVSCFVGEGRWNVDAQRFDGAPDWERINAKIVEVLQRAQHERSTQQAPPPAYAASVALPDGWKQYTDSTTGKPYYHHAATNTTQWDRPGPPQRPPPL